MERPFLPYGRQEIDNTDREAVLRALTDRYGETVRAMGLAGTTRMVEVFASEATGSWTITVTTPDGVTCLIASGEAFEAIPPLPGGNDA